VPRLADALSLNAHSVSCAILGLWDTGVEAGAQTNRTVVSKEGRIAQASAVEAGTMI